MSSSGSVPHFSLKKKKKKKKACNHMFLFVWFYLFCCNDFNGQVSRSRKISFCTKVKVQVLYPFTSTRTHLLTQDPINQRPNVQAAQGVNLASSFFGLKA